MRTRMRLAESYQLDQDQLQGQNNNGQPKPGQQAAQAARMAADSMPK